MGHRHVEDLNRPYGLAWRNDELLVADQDGIWRVPHVVGALARRPAGAAAAGRRTAARRSASRCPAPTGRRC